ncbi:nucleoside hydrolase [Sutcliffiella rhizosphaerae]|uniref:Pyrimidine-specific ribonucleoside hydrolase RihA n=1 Tax=Sutcliffiella rhizosphaerae TaxID=2880967 RepID=A0ABM8YQB8_9BACI|nr:nucleoside hydrolase [Sutcliffiella rhizosphaerae]CAG9621997.1 Pyrimidine-specific ribonucleoside hydrolase RihA [Sutcliffiella rhizosphaerae]
MTKKVLLFADFGIDDILAIIYAYYEKSIQIVGVVAEYGNVTKKTAIRNARYLQRNTGRYDIPLIGGAERSMIGDPAIYYPEVHGPEGFGGYVVNEDFDEPEDVFENFHQIYDIIEKYDGNITIVCIGRLTSLATSFILYPETVEKVNGIFVMGGSFNFPGNVTPIAEANIFGDPYAANIVFNHASNLTIFPLNVTQRAILTSEMVNYIDQVSKMQNNHLGMLIKPMMDYYWQFYKSQIPIIDGAPLHDVLTLWGIFNDDHIIYEIKPVKIVTSLGSGFGQTIGDFRDFVQLAEYPVHRIAMKFDYDVFIERVVTVLTVELNKSFHGNKTSNEPG